MKINDVFINGQKEDIKFTNRNVYRCKLVKGFIVHAKRMKYDFNIQTIEGMMKGNKGDWLIMNPAEELYPMTNSVFIRTYEKKDI